MIKTTKKEISRCLLVGIDIGELFFEQSMEELKELVFTAEGEIVGQVVQKRLSIDKNHVLGQGKLDEIKDFIDENDVDLVIFNNELTPHQINNLEELLDCRVIDRTVLILDIFAMHAKTSEGKLQVEAAQLKYMLPRLVGSKRNLSRLAGGIGTRGPGETKLETDRRHIRRKIQYIKNELDNVERRREMQHKRRKKNGVLTAAIVGYTNAGKSTLMNRLTDAGVLQEDKLFATLDPTARKLLLPDGRRIMIVDTVGFISRLPHQLVDAFRSTLEEATYADVILNVCDASSPECENHIKTTNDILASLFDGGIVNVPVISVFNKCDLAGDINDVAFLSEAKSVCISAQTGYGIDNLLQAVTDALPQTRRRVNLLLPFDKAAIAAKIRNDGVIHSEEYIQQGIFLDCTAEISFLDTIKDYIV